jgi:hypothetical protein
MRADVTRHSWTTTGPSCSCGRLTLLLLSTGLKVQRVLLNVWLCLAITLRWYATWCTMLLLKLELVSHFVRVVRQVSYLSSYLSNPADGGLQLELVLLQRSLHERNVLIRRVPSHSGKVDLTTITYIISAQFHALIRPTPDLAKDSSESPNDGASYSGRLLADLLASNIENALVSHQHVLCIPPCCSFQCCSSCHTPSASSCQRSQAEWVHEDPNQCVGRAKSAPRSL